MVGIEAYYYLLLSLAQIKSMPSRRKAIAVVLFFAALILLNFPIVDLAAHSLWQQGWPPLLYYLLAVWLLLIFALYKLYKNRASTPQ